MIIDLHPFNDLDRMRKVYFKTAVAAVALPFAPIISFGVGSSALADLVTKIEDRPNHNKI